jgi:hypothetical protein
VVGAASLEHGLVRATTAGADANHGTDRALHDLLRAGGQADARLAGVRVVRDDGGVVA